MTPLTEALRADARHRLADLAGQLAPDVLARSVDAPLDALAETYGESASDTAVSNLPEYLARFVQHAYRVLPVARVLTTEQARDLALGLLAAGYDTAGGRGCDGMWADVQRHGPAALPMILGALSGMLKHQLHEDHQRSVADRGVHTLAWPLQCALVTALFEVCGAYFPPELSALPPAQLAGAIFVSMLVDVVGEVGPELFTLPAQNDSSAAAGADAP
jgi:hypothetical protein